MRKIFLLLLFLINKNHLFAMEAVAIDYTPLFVACKRDDALAIINFIKENPTADINHKNENEETPLLLAAARHHGWPGVDYLLEQENVDKMFKDKCGRSLFSYSVYSFKTNFNNTLRRYRPVEIHALCTAAFPNRHEFGLPVPSEFTDVLEGKKPLELENEHGSTALDWACSCVNIPMIINLLKRGADLNREHTVYGGSPYKSLATYQRGIAPLFVVREALSEDAFPLAVLISFVCAKIGLIPDVGKIIKQLYIEKITDELLSTAQAQIWKPVCIDACRLGGIQETDIDSCLRHVLLLPQAKKTEINIALALAGK